MASTSTASNLALTVIRASDVKWQSTFRSKLPNLYVEIEFNDNRRQTQTIEKTLAPQWNRRFSFTLPPTDQGAKFKFRLKHNSLVIDKCIGEIDVEYSDLLNWRANGKETALHLNSFRDSVSTGITAVLHLRLQIIDSIADTGQSIDAAGQAIQRIGISTSVAATDSTAVVTVDAATNNFTEHTDLYNCVGDLVEKLRVFTQVMDALSQIHPYVNFAWQVASALYNAIEYQFKVDKKVVDLAYTMRDAFDFVGQIDALRDKTARLKDTIIKLLKQTDECCLFIQEYARRNFARRIAMLSADATIDEYLNALRMLKSSIDSEVTAYVAFVSSRISSTVDALFLENRLNPDKMNSFDRPQCFAGTRKTILDEIVEWSSSGSDQNVFWLYGAAGSGKSTVSTTIAERFRAIYRLGAQLFFRRGESETNSVVRTLAYKLASFDSSIAKHVLESIGRDNDIVEASEAVQFEKLIKDPLDHTREAMQGPVIIVLDALDECGAEKSRRGLLKLLREGLAVLPKNFRFLITSRKELDIDRALNFQPECILAVELEHDSTTCRDDVHRYIDHEMREVFKKNVLEITDDWEWKMDRLGDAAGGLFVWASTVVRLVDCDDPLRELEELTSRSQSLSGLNQLYDSVLRGSGISFDNESKNRFSQILGLILLGKVPLSDYTIDELLGYSNKSPSRLILSRLQSVLVYTPGTPVYFCHNSFRDYLVAPERESDPWFIDVESQQKMITSRCFDVMRDMLRFNICDIQSSHIPNNKIPDLPDRIKANIPPHLEYACLFWNQHLLEAPFSRELLDKLSEFLNKHLLYWLEVMSFLGKVNIAGLAFHHTMNWVSSHNANILSFLRDARRMVTRFSQPISQSTPHIYVSALLFASKESKFIARYSKPNLPIVQVEQIGVRQRSPLLKELTGHMDIVRSVAFSPNGTRVASSSYDKTIRIWDAESGQVIFGPFEGHGGYVQSIAFSPDGACIVSGSSNTSIRIWDVESGQMTSRPMEGHDGEVLSVAFSPDGMRVASGSADKTAIVWDVKSGQTIRCFEEHEGYVYSVAFSPDGKHIVSGSADKMIRIWEIENGQNVCGPLEGHANFVSSVTFSHDGTCVASGSWDNTIRIWDAQSGECISKPFEGHTSWITSIAFSPDSRHIASGSHDETVRIWDVESGQVISGPFVGHTLSVESVAFSPDGTRVVSGSRDNMMRIWDAESGQTVSGDFEGHTDAVYSVAFSLDGKRVVSGSYDSTIRIWDAESGRTVSGPFKGHSDWVNSVAFSPDGRRVASSSGDCTIRVWDAESGNVVSGPFIIHEDMAHPVCFSPDGTCVMSGSDDGTLRIWEIETGRMVFGPFKGYESGVRSVAFSPDGRSVVSGPRDKTIIVWDIESGEIIAGPLKGHTDVVWSVAFSPDGARIISGSSGGTILIWSVKNGQVVAGPFKGHTAGVLSVAFSPDGARVVSCSDDRTIRVWDAESGQAVFAPFEGHTDGVLSVAFSPDGKRVISGSADHTIRMWNVEDPYFDWTMDTNGWIRGRNGELLVWIPLDLRTPLWRPQNTALFSCAFLTKLDFSNTALGERWQECFEPPQ